MPAPKTDGKENIVFQGKIVEVVQQPMKIGDNKVTFEFARRSPGTRLIIVDSAKKQVLLTKEFRHEHNDFDYRLPGGKVFDTLDEYNAFLQTKKDILDPATQQARVEAQEEAGIKPVGIEHYYTSLNGATVVWDLFYFVIKKWDQVGQELGEGEDIEVTWVGYEQAKKLILDGSMAEDRSAIVLLRWLEENR